MRDQQEPGIAHPYGDLSELWRTIIEWRYSLDGKLDLIAACILLLYCKGQDDKESLKLRRTLLNLISGMRPSFFYDFDEEG